MNQRIGHRSAFYGVGLGGMVGELAEKELTIEIKKPALIILLIILSIFFIFELQATFGSPIAFGDEAYYTRMAQWIGENLEYPKWIPFRITNVSRRAYTKPPLWDILQGSLAMIFGFQESLIKFFTPFISLLVGISSFLLIKRICNERIGFLAAVMLATIPSFVVYAVTFYTDALETLYLTMFFLLFIIGLKDERMKYLLASVCFLTLAYFTKKTGLVAFAFIPLAFVYEVAKKRPIWQLLKKYSMLLLVPLILSSALMIRTFVMYGAPCDIPIFEFPMFEFMFPPNDCDEIKFVPKYEYAGRVEETGSEKTVLDMGALEYLNFAYGNVWLVVFGAFAGGLILATRRKEVDILLLAALLIYMLVLLRGLGRSEDAARFALPWAPIICLLAASYFDEMYKFIRTYQKYIAVALFFVVVYFGYRNFSDKIGVMTQVKQFYPSFFEACDWIKDNTPKDALISTLWIYRAGYCMQRQVTTSGPDITQSNDVSYILDVAKQFGITHIWVNKFSTDPLNRHLSEMYDLKYVQLLESNPQDFKKIYETGPPINECTQRICDGNIIYEIVYGAENKTGG